MIALRDESHTSQERLTMDRLIQQMPSEVVAVAEKLRAEGISSNTGGSEIVEGRVTNYTNPVHEGMDSSTVSVADKDQDVWTTETHVTDEKGLGTTESPADSGVDVPLVVEARKETAKEFEQSIARLPPGERVAKIKEKVQEVVKIHNLKKDRALSKKTGRDVYTDNEGHMYSVDTQHGRFEMLDKRGNHIDEVNFDLELQDKTDKSGGHNLNVK